MRSISGLLLLLALALHAHSQNSTQRALQVLAEKQHIADLGNGYYQNPIIAGNFGDPSVVKVGKEYYMAKSTGNGFLMMHSRDLVNWEPVIKHSFKDMSTIWAIDLQYIDGQYRIYLPCGNWPGKTKEHYQANFVTVSARPEGPWSEPIRIDNQYIPDNYFTGIDPGFVQNDKGERFLYNDHGYVMPLDKEGLKAIAQPKVVYKGWAYPRDWIVEGECLESPKLFSKDGYYYLVSAMGGTSGPSTAHMAVVARSKSATGPWENSPYNPLVHTYSADETWWQQGHATIIEGPDGSWWTIYHARLKDYTGIGRQSLLMPIEWRADGWPVIKNNYKAWDIIPKPIGENVGHGIPVSDDFTSIIPGIQWNTIEKGKYTFGNGKLIMEAFGTDSANGNSITVNANNKSFEATIEINISEGATAGICFGNNEGLKTDGVQVSYNLGAIWRTLNTAVTLKEQGHVYLKIRNFKQDLSFYSSDDNLHWTTFQNGVRNANYTVKLFAAGKGEVTFSNFKYLGLE